MTNPAFAENALSSPPSPQERGAGPRGGLVRPTPARPARLAILISGRGSNMLALLEATKTGVLQGLAEVVVVFSNQPDTLGLEAAAAHGCPVAALPSQGRHREAFDAEAAQLLQQYQPDLVVLAGYMRILSSAFIQPFAGRILNIHPADTHQHQGLHAYEWAFDNQLPETKITVHLVDEGLDTGPILAQQTVDLRGADTLAEVERRGLAVEHELYARALADLIQNKRNVMLSAAETSRLPK